MLFTCRQPRSRLYLFVRHSSALRIAFFGSDKFSIESLRHMVKLKETLPGLIDVIDVITRRPKPFGRGLKQLRDVPITQVAEEYNLRLLRADTSAEINALVTENYSLAIAVSYGKLIPARFLQALPFGGLNVHPSLLPAYSGASPLQYALLNMDPSTGVTVQNLHPTRFDAGEILLQSPELAISENETYDSLCDRLAMVGGQLLATVVRESLYIDPKPITGLLPYSYTSKIDKGRARIRWEVMSAREIARYYNTLGPLYTYKECCKLDKKTREMTSEVKRVTLKGVKVESREFSLSQVGEFILEGSRLVIKARDGYVSAETLTLQTYREESAASFVSGLRKKTGDSRHVFLSEE
ncbi:hypothetical protein BABINDRAFT_63254 [Babjeviella inositovora NRRL Y-12698]|uniref:methionyl-tRNA formyltransferase n=1 Tax=Babjeviella inositovora NRRL Y-12698 TaxID=984486 RepID=A0A1E3QR89_9ASCO|nr:uncharacterized protein BABINDRAFT_63254 [Babjeviella inositovora NRRL Y-12698]ODQ79572.1 hypothetical protein BABINDRAFT_63254 [Babjeviella inositovora NRRL Y-12698]